MMDLLLTLNAGSSSVKFALFEPGDWGPLRRASGQVEGLNTRAMLHAGLAGAQDKHSRALTTQGPASHREALTAILSWVRANVADARIGAVGHRVVHGGKSFTGPALIDDKVLAVLAALEPLAPLHQPHNVAGILVARATFPGAPQVACFDTAFHRCHPFVADAFALPRHFYDEGIRRYGFHGLSYESVVDRLRHDWPDAISGRIIVAHLGNGASMCAIRDGRSVASTMGFTALDGLPMGTRCGQLDPGVLLYLMTQKGMDAGALSDLLYTQSGLKGLSGLSSDMRELEGSSLPEAREAIDYLVARVRHELGGLAAEMSGVDTIVMTGGIGQHAWRVREKILRDMDWIGLQLDPAANEAGKDLVSKPGSRVRALVIETDEEAMIAQHTMLVSGIDGTRVAAKASRADA